MKKTLLVLLLSIVVNGVLTQNITTTTSTTTTSTTTTSSTTTTTSANTTTSTNTTHLPATPTPTPPPTRLPPAPVPITKVPPSNITMELVTSEDVRQLKSIFSKIRDTIDHAVASQTLLKEDTPFIQSVVESVLLVEDTLTVTDTSVGLSLEDFSTSLAQIPITSSLTSEKSINVGNVAGQRVFAPEPFLSDLGCDQSFPIKCNAFLRYRTFSGVCNNLKNVLWGSANSRLRRLLPAQYADIDNEPRGGRMSSEPHCNTGNKCFIDSCPCISDPVRLLPNPRFVSDKFHPEMPMDDRTTHLFTIFGQFLDHDLTLTIEGQSKDCCNSFDRECFPIHIPCNSTSTQELTNFTCNGNTNPYSNTPVPEGENTHKCLPFTRSISFCDEDLCTRDQMNGITAFIDASNVYGSSVDQLPNLFDENGMHRVGPNNLLPRISINKQELAGDIRATEHPGLTTLHTIFMREHNRILNEFISLFGASDPSLITSMGLETRRIVGAEMQNIVYNEWLPILLGSTITKHRLRFHFTDSYDPDVDPSILNSFSTAAFRFGHSMIQGMFEMFSTGSNPTVVDKYNLREHFNDMSKYREDSGLGMERILAGMMRQQSQKRDEFVVDDLRNFLFANSEINCLGSDLVARNIQRGRDHGLPAYNDFRELCKLQRACSWEEVPEEISEEKWEMLRHIYDDPNDIDLFTGGLAEKPHAGGIVGATFNCIIADQFNRLKFGDRFFFTFNQIHPFDVIQLDQIRRRTLADIICDNTDIEEVPKNVFIASNDAIKCNGKGHNQLNLKFFFNVF